LARQGLNEFVHLGHKGVIKIKKYSCWPTVPSVPMMTTFPYIHHTTRVPQEPHEIISMRDGKI